MASPRYLTKSRFKLAAECPTKLFYTGKEDIYRNAKQEDSFLAMLADGGYQVGELAKCLFSDGVEVDAIGHDAALAQTHELLQQDKVVIFEAAIAFENLFVRIDVLVKDGDYFELIEVKAKSYSSMKPEIVGSRGDLLSGMRPYIEDVAFQAHVLRSVLPSVHVKTYLMMPDKAVKVSVDGLNQLFKIERVGNRSKVVTSPKAKDIEFNGDMLAKVCVDDYVAMVMSGGVLYMDLKEKLPVLAKQWSEAYRLDQKVTPLPGKHCANCEFQSKPGDGMRSGFEECWTDKFGFSQGDFAQGTVLDIWNYRGKSKLISDGRVRLSAVREDDIKPHGDGLTLSASERQWMQVNGIPPEEDQGGYWIAQSHMQHEMASWTYPYHFIDFETSTVAIPFYEGLHPYEPIAFQFSHHVMQQDGTVAHADEFLMTAPDAFPNFVFVRALKEALSKDEGTIFMWSAHENTILTRVTRQLQEASNPPDDASELIEFIQSITKGGKRAMYDLYKLSKDAYFHVNTQGSSSIKKVLPAVLASSAWLKRQYSQPIYGGKGAMTSKNYQDFVWWQHGPEGKPMEPYALLADYGSDLLGEQVESDDDPDEMVIAEGGAAATAYARLQFEDMQPGIRDKINAALLRYCELDTLAMVMIVQGWRDLAQNHAVTSPQ